MIVRIAISVCAQGIVNASLGVEDGLQLLYNFMVLDRSRYESASISKAARASSEQISNLLIMHAQTRHCARQRERQGIGPD